MRSLAVPALLAASLILCAPASAARLPGGALVALAAGPGSAYAVVASPGGARPFRLVRSGGRGARVLGGFGSPGAAFADVAAGPGGPVVASGRPTSDGYEYESASAARGLGAAAPLGEGTGPAVLALDGDVPIAAFPDADGDAVLLRGGAITRLTSTGPALRHAPLDAVGGPGGPLVLDRVQSRARSELRVLGPAAPSAPVVSARGLRALDGTVARDDERIYVAYRDGARRLVLASAPPHPGARWSRRRLHVRGRLNGPPGVARVGLRTVVATSQRTRRRYRVFLTTVGPAGAFLDRLSGGGGSDLAPRAASGPDDRIYVAWTHRGTGRHGRRAVLRRVL